MVGGAQLDHADTHQEALWHQKVLPVNAWLMDPKPNVTRFGSTAVDVAQGVAFERCPRVTRSPGG